MSLHHILAIEPSKPVKWVPKSKGDMFVITHVCLESELTTSVIIKTREFGSITVAKVSSYSPQANCSIRSNGEI